MRCYKVWVKGKKLETERIVQADNKADALFRLALLCAVKSFQCDGRLLKKGE